MACCWFCGALGGGNGAAASRALAQLVPLAITRGSSSHTFPCGVAKGLCTTEIGDFSPWSREGGAEPICMVSPLGERRIRRRGCDSASGRALGPSSTDYGRVVARCPASRPSSFATPYRTT
jgi:hypothetical protein